MKSVDFKIISGNNVLNQFGLEYLRPLWQHSELKLCEFVLLFESKHILAGSHDDHEEAPLVLIFYMAHNSMIPEVAYILDTN